MQQETKPFETSGGSPMEGRSINPTVGKKDVSPIGSVVRKCGLWVSQENTIKKQDFLYKPNPKLIN
jgi:hypothetical protein